MPTECKPVTEAEPLNLEHLLAESNRLKFAYESHDTSIEVSAFQFASIPSLVSKVRELQTEIQYCAHCLCDDVMKENAELKAKIGELFSQIDTLRAGLLSKE